MSASVDEGVLFRSCLADMIITLGFPETSALVSWKIEHLHCHLILVFNELH